MFFGQEDYFGELTGLVKKEIALYVKYAVRFTQDGRIRHIFNTKLFKEEVANIMEDAFSHLDWTSYLEERSELTAQWHMFHEEAWRTMKENKVMLPFEYMLRRLQLTEFEQYAACLSVAPELNREFERFYIYIQDDLSWRYPSLDLCIKMYTMDGQEQNALIHQAAVRRDFLNCIFCRQETMQESGLNQRFWLSRNLIDFVFFYEGDLRCQKAQYRLYFLGREKMPLCNINENISKSLVQLIEESGIDSVSEQNKVAMRLCFLRGPHGSGKKMQIKLAAKKMGYAVMVLDARELANRDEQHMIETAGDAVVRAYLDHAFFVIANWEAIWSGDKKKRYPAQEILRKAALFFNQIFLTVEEEGGADLLEGEYPDGYRREEFHMRFPSIGERSLLWREFLPRETEAEWLDEIFFERLSAQFDFAPGVIKEAAESALGKAGAGENYNLTADMIYQACQQKITHRLGERAARVNAAYSWDDLVLADGPKELLRQAVGQVSYRARVYEQWGFEGKIAYGRGVSLLFAGPPGTGKTMAAQVIARELNLELYKVDLSGVLSKYIGETQKNLREIFDEVKKSRSILFFDEADVLFGKRVDVSDARDISANAQTAYLLQKMEEYDGITILATNLMQNFDDAYKRRMKFIIRFTFPQKEQRIKLWEKVFPGQMPLDTDIDTRFLAENFELSGAEIKNIAVNAAFLAAMEHEITGMRHIMTALQQEYEKSGKILGKAELKEYYIYKI